MLGTREAKSVASDGGAGGREESCESVGRSSLTGEGGSAGWPDALGDQQLMVLLACQGAVHNLVLPNLRLAVVPLEVQAGGCTGANTQVLRSVNL